MNRSLRTSIAAGAVALVASVPAFGAASGSGATFPQLVYRDWCQQIGCSYTGKGSSGGIRDLTAGTVDFAGTDAVMTESQNNALASARNNAGVLYFPTLLGAISVPTNTPAGRLRLNGPTLGLIFSGGITRWNDRRIRSLQPAAVARRLPNQNITVCVRADGSGTSFGFTLYLEKVSPQFKARVGNASQQPNWTAPNIVRGPGNPGVAQCVKDNRNSIGYVDLGDALNAGLGSQVAAIGKGEVVRVRKRVRGRTVTRNVRRVMYRTPSAATVSAAANLRSVNLRNPYGLQRALVASTAPGSYPITITTFALTYQSYGRAGKGGKVGDVRSFLNHAYRPASQQMVRKYGFAPLPASMLKASKAQMRQLG